MFKRQNPVIRHTRWVRLIILLVPVLGIWSWVDAPAQSISTEWFYFNPTAFTTARVEPVELRIKVAGNPSSVQLQLAAGGMMSSDINGSIF
ncbi:MAG: hypothetical protein HY650_15340 [Acidobacteria bacterium]|nr:hypothetical protein [Acidobacteriota bacterium]